MSHPEQGSSKLDIYTMPLTQVSIEHGTEGLYARLQHALGNAGLADSEMIQASLRLGLELHQDDRRTYEPYNNHLLRVTLRLLEELRIADEVTLAAAPLHDSIEDHAVELIRRLLDTQSVPVDPYSRRFMGHQALRLFAGQFDAPDIADIVLEVSASPRQPNVSKIQAYLGYTATIMGSGDPRAMALKHGDFIDNTDSPAGAEDTQKRAYLDKKQIGAYPLHIAGLEREDSLVTGDTREEILAVLRRLEAGALARIRLRGEDKPGSLRTA